MNTHPCFTVLIRSAVAAVALGALALPAAGQGGSDSTSTGDGSAAFAAHAITLDEVEAGDLLWRSESGLLPLPMLDTDAEIRVSGVMIHGTVTQTFQNPSSTVIEAVYVFPLPENAAVHHMEMRIGDRRIVSVVKEREQAKRVYVAARDAGQKAALLDQERPNLFTSSVANINPGESIEVELAYVEEAFYRDGEFSLVFPLTFTPRFVPDAVVRVDESSGALTVTAHRVSDAGRITPPFQPATSPTAPTASFRVHIDAGFPLDEVMCPSHDVRIVNGIDGWEVAPRIADVSADRDVRVYWRPVLGHAPSAVLLTEDRDDGRYGLLMIAPPHPKRIEEGGGLATETMFVLDVSGSMQGPSIEQAREALLAALDRLRPRDRFNIITFNNDTRLYADTFQPGTDAAVRRARRFVQALEAGGGTRIYPALLRAISMFDPKGDEDAVDVAPRILFLTDGAVGNEAEVLRRLFDGLGVVRLHMIGIGHSPNRYLMEKMAENGRGHCAFIAETTTAENAIDRFFARLARPVLTDIEVEWTGPAPESVVPSRLPDLHAGDTLVASIRWPEGPSSGEVIVRGRSTAGEFRSILALPDTATGGTGIAHRWARATVDDLMDALDGGADSGEIRRDVIDVGLAHNLVTRYTSLVAVDAVATAAGPARPAKVANALPHGSQLLGSPLPKGGTSAPLRRRVALGLILAAAALALTGRALGEWHVRARG